MSFDYNVISANIGICIFIFILVIVMLLGLWFNVNSSKHYNPEDDESTLFENLGQSKLDEHTQNKIKRED